MGDPETEVVMPRLKTNLAELCLAAAENRLKDITIATDDRTAVTIVAVSGGYPGNFEKGFKIEMPDLQNNPDTIIFQAGTKLQNEDIVTNGGRVLCVTSFGEDIKDAVIKSMAVLQRVNFTGMYYRRDIGYEFL